MDTFQSLMYGLSVSLTPINLAYCALGVVLGTLVGVLPGIGPLGGITLLLPTTFGMEPISAIIMLAGIYYGAMYGGSTTSILVNIPGEAASVVTCFDGYQMARQGRAGPALSMAAIGSYIAGTLSIVGLMLLAPMLARLALKFGPPEQFALMVFGLIVLAYMGTGSVLKALMMIVVGLLLAMVGIDQLSGFTRFTYGRIELGDGISFLAVAMGLFGVAEILVNLEQTAVAEVIKPKLANCCPHARTGSVRSAPFCAVRAWGLSSAFCQAQRTLSRPLCRMPWRSACPGTQKNLARGALKAWPDRRRPITLLPAGPWCPSWPSGCRLPRPPPP